MLGTGDMLNSKSTLFCSSAVLYWALAGNIKKNYAHLGTRLLSVHGKRKPVFDICFSPFFEIHYLTCFVKAFKSLARFHLPGEGVVLTLLSLKRLFLERNVPGKFTSLHYVPFLTQGMAPMLSATFMEINLNKSNC